MKVLLINGSPHEAGSTYTALAECAREFEALGIEARIAWIGTDAVHGCTACLGCRKNDGHCVYDEDRANDFIDLADKADGIIIGSPVYYAGINGTLKALLDRMFYAGFAKLAHKPGAAISSARRAGTTPTIDQINKFFEICQMPVVSSVYWPMIHGNNAQEAMQDKEGLQTMRVLARNMAYLLKCQEAGRAAGILPPEPEPKVKTNFIR